MVGSSNATPDPSMDKLKQSGGYIVAVIALALAGYFGWEYYQSHRTLGVDEEASEKFANIETLSQRLQESQDSDANNTQQMDELNQQVEALVSEHGDTIYAWQALMQQARLATDSDDLETASLALKTASEMNLEDAGLNTIARLRYATVLLAREQTDEAYSVASAEMPASFEGSQQELLGDIYMAQSKTDEAIRSYENAWNLLSERGEERGILKLKLEGLGINPEPIKADDPVVSMPEAQVNPSLDDDAENDGIINDNTDTETIETSSADPMETDPVNAETEAE